MYRRRYIRLFVSSTFIDMKLERDLLQEKVFPEIKEYCHEHGWEFEGIDLRWGISREAGYSQRTMQICLNELHRCQTISPKPNFLVLIGGRYGWIPLPEYINPLEMDDLECIATPEEINILSRWYILDENYLPSGLYILQAREVKDNIDYLDDDIYNELVYFPLRTLFERYADVSRNEGLRIRFNSSATEQEVSEGALMCDNSEHVMIFERILTDIPSAEEYSVYFEEDSKNKLECLKNKLFKKTKKRFTIKTKFENYGTKEYTDSFCGKLKEMIIGIIENEIQNYIEQPPVELDKEVAWRKVEELVKHDASSDCCLRIENSNDDRYYSLVDILKNKTRLTSNEICFNSVYRKNTIICQGMEISGISNILAKTALTLKQSDNDVIIRIVEYNERLTSGILLLQSIWEEMNKLYPSGKDFSEENVRDMIANLVPKRPLYIIIDGVDRYHLNDPIYNYKWLPSNWENPVFLICSVTTDNYVSMTNSIHLRIKDYLRPEEAMDMIINELRLSARRLTEVQYNVVLDFLNSCNSKILSFSNLTLLANVLKRCDSTTMLYFGEGDNFSYEYITELADPKNLGEISTIMFFALACLRQGMSVDEFCKFIPRITNYWDYYIKNESVNTTVLLNLPTSVCIRILNDIESVIDYQYTSNKYLFKLKNKALKEFLQYYQEELNEMKELLVPFYMDVLLENKDSGDVVHALNEASFIIRNSDDSEFIEQYFCSLFIVILKYMTNVADLIRNDYSVLLSKPLGHELRKKINELLYFDNMVSNYIENNLHDTPLSKNLAFKIVMDLASGYAPGTLIRQQFDDISNNFQNNDNFTPYMYNTMGYKDCDELLLRILPCSFNVASQLLYPYVLWKNSNVDELVYVYNLETFTRSSISSQLYKNYIVRISDGEVFLIGNKSFSFMNFNFDNWGYSRIELTSHGYRTKYTSRDKMGYVFDAVVCKMGDNKYRFAILQEHNIVEIIDSDESYEVASEKSMVDVSKIKLKQHYKVELVGFICNGKKLVIKTRRDGNEADGGYKFKSIVAIYDSETFTLINSEGYGINFKNVCPVVANGNIVAFGVGLSVVWYDYSNGITKRNSILTSRTLYFAPVYFLSVSDDGKNILSMCGDNKLNSIDVESKNVKCLINFPTSMPELIGHGNKFIANLSGYYDNEDKYNFDRLLLLDNYEKSLDIYPPAIFSISADTNGKHIIVSSGYFLKMGNHGITRYDYNDGNIKKYEENEESFEIYARATTISPDNKFYAYSRGNFIIYKDFSNKYKKIFQFEPTQNASSEHIVSMKFTPDGKFLLAYMGADNELIAASRYNGMLFRVDGNETGPIKEYIHNGKYNEYWMDAHKVDISPNGRYAIITDNDGYQCIDLFTGKTMAGKSCCKKEQSSIKQFVCWMPDGFMMKHQSSKKSSEPGQYFSISPSGGVAIVEYDGDSPWLFWGHRGKINYRVKLIQDKIYNISWCYDGIHFFVIGEKYVWLYDTVGKKTVQKFIMNYNGVENKKNIKYHKGRLYLNKVDYMNGVIFYNGEKLFRLEPSSGYKINHTVVCNISQLWNFERDDYMKPTAYCPACGKRFAPPEHVLEVIKNLNGNIDNLVSPIMTLPDEAWLSKDLSGHTCPNCGMSIKFNPFISHVFSTDDDIPILEI